MSIVLPPHLEAIVKQKISQGAYSSSEQVISEALQALEEREESQAERLACLRGKVAAGLAQLDRGEGIPGDEVFDFIAI